MFVYCACAHRPRRRSPCTNPKHRLCLRISCISIHVVEARYSTVLCNCERDKFTQVQNEGGSTRLGRDSWDFRGSGKYSRGAGILAPLSLRLFFSCDRAQLPTATITLMAVVGGKSDPKETFVDKYLLTRSIVLYRTVHTRTRYVCAQLYVQMLLLLL